MKLFQHRVQVFCAFCRSSRKIYGRRRIGLSHIIGSALAAGLMMIAIWREFNPRVSILFVVFLVIAEVFVQLRWRISLTCRHCGFDPILYKKNSEKAAEKVKLHLERRKEDPRYLLAAPLNLPRRPAPPSMLPPSQPDSEAKSGSLISRQI